MAKGNFYYNYPKVIAYLKKHEYVYHEFNAGQQIRILADGKIVDLWPSRMVYHIVESEEVIPSHQSKWPRLNIYFEEAELDEVFAL